MGEFLSLSFPGIFIGFVTGLFSGFFGIGGGLISTPLIRTFLGVGFIGGLLGLGGGFLMIPLFVHWLKKGFGVLLIAASLYFAYAEFTKVFAVP